MIRKKAQSTAACPAWMVTYGDFMGLLLCFFVMYAAMSTINKQQFGDAMASIQEALGLEHAIGNATLLEPARQGMVQRLRAILLIKDTNQTTTLDSQISNKKNLRIEQLPNGLKIADGTVLFENGSAALPQEALASLKAIAPDIKGGTTKIEIRGHSSIDPLPPDSHFKDRMDLGYARAKAVADVLIQNGVEPQRVRLVSCGASEPIKVADASENGRRRNNRVEIILTEALVDELKENASVKQ